MKNKKSIFKWIIAIMALFIAGLCYAVYFTDLGKPAPSESDQQISMYEHTAAPTLFVQWQQVPIVELDWAYADQNLLKFALKIHGLETNMHPADWVCQPYITLDKPVERRLTGYGAGPVHDAKGEAIQLIYEYEIKAGNYNSLKVDMDLTIGPCGDYWNGSNVTPAVIPELVGNYHLSFEVPIKTSSPSPARSVTPENTAIATWEDVPVFPGAVEVQDDAAGYHYRVDKTDPDTLMLFYRNAMRDTGWELLMNGIDLNTGYDLLYTKGEDILHIDIFVKEKMTHVVLHLE